MQVSRASHESLNKIQDTTLLRKKGNLFETFLKEKTRLLVDLKPKIRSNV